MAQLFLHPSTHRVSFAISSTHGSDEPPRGTHPGWHLRLELRTLARRLLSTQAAPRQGARLCRRPLLDHRNQWHLFYSLQRPTSFARWAAATPDDFVFSVKGSRYITHMLRLRNAEQALANFFGSGLLLLGPKLGPILWQFPPSFTFDARLLEDFFQLLPPTAAEAAILGRRHDSRLEGRAHTETDKNRPLRHAIEIRHDSFIAEEFIHLLRRHRIALVCADTVSWPRLVDATADFIYCRLHGSRELYASGYGSKALATWAERIAAWATGNPPNGKRVSPFSPTEASPHDVYVYFDNDMKVRAPADALSLARRLTRLELLGLSSKN